MGRFATAAIIGLALAGAAVESHAGGLPGTAPAKAASPSVPAEQLLADAAPAPTPDAPPAPPAGPMGMGNAPMGAMPHGQMMGWGGGRPDTGPGMPGPMWRLHRLMQTWGLFYNQRDKNLSNGDVQVLAQAILLIHGNHDWKVIDVADAADGQATFAYATADGSVIARFSIDRHSGRLTRIG